MATAARSRCDGIPRPLCKAVSKKVYTCEGGACGCVRKPGSLTLAFSVGFVVFAALPQKLQTPPAWAGTPSTGFTCMVCCLPMAKTARRRVPQLWSGVSCFFDDVEKTRNPTRMGSVREPGSLTHPLVKPIGAGTPLRAFFALRKQSSPQVNPIEGRQPLEKTIVVVFGSYAAKHHHIPSQQKQPDSPNSSNHNYHNHQDQNNPPPTGLLLCGWLFALFASR